jgi:hypothetical protein
LTNWSSSSAFVPTARRRDMSDLRVPVFHCPFCGRVKKHGEWVKLTTEELVKLYRCQTVIVVGLTCPDDKKFRTL